jgi:hypothetical protein
MPKGSTEGSSVAKVYTPPWNKKRLAPPSPHGTRHLAAVNAAAANAGGYGVTSLPLSPSTTSFTVQSPARAGARGGETGRSPLSPQRDSSEQGLAHAADVAGARGHMIKCYPVVSLSTQMAQVCVRESESRSERERVCAGNHV